MGFPPCACGGSGTAHHPKASQAAEPCTILYIPELPGFNDFSFRFFIRGDSMSLLDRLSQPQCWESFYEYKLSHACPPSLAKELRGFIDAREYLPVCERISRGDRFPLPKKSVVSKLSSEKKRVVYTYPREENYVLKLLTYLILREYDGVFCPALYSFRPNRGAKDAIRYLSRVRGLREMYSYKLDVSDYFNSVPVERLLPELENALAEDPALFSFLKGLLEEPEVLDGGKRVTERKGIMAGTPVASFYANLYLAGLDRYFYEKKVPYARYSDDIILFAPTREALDGYAAELRGFLAGRGLSVNPKKEERSAPGEMWTFLGFSYRDGVVDVSPVSVTKLKGKMRRKTRALRRWRQRNGLDGEKAARAFIRIFNRKLFDNPAYHELTWTYWFFPVITTADSLRVIDNYAQDCVRVLVSDTHTKKRFDVRYEDMKKMGLRSLVHEYYAFRGREKGADGKNDP